MSTGHFAPSLKGEDKIHLRGESQEAESFVHISNHLDMQSADYPSIQCSWNISSSLFYLIRVNKQCCLKNTIYFLIFIFINFSFHYILPPYSKPPHFYRNHMFFGWSGQDDSFPCHPLPAILVNCLRMVSWVKVVSSNPLLFCYYQMEEKLKW